jgi:hypothetical protein
MAARLDPVIGRDDEARRLVRILCRRTKNNPVLVGEVGGDEEGGLRGLQPGLQWGFAVLRPGRALHAPCNCALKSVGSPATGCVR